MDYVKANSVEAAVEKHLPAVTVSGNKVHVQVGSVLHPMEEAHFIQYILLETDKGFERKVLHPGMKPEMDFEVKAGEKPVAAYEYCTKHGLWMSEIK
jgi:superoxide reductase